MKTLLLFLAIVVTNLAICQTDTDSNYIYDCANSICVESLNVDSSEIMDFSKDNMIYRQYLEFIYEYKYIKDDHVYFIGNNGHLLVHPDSIDNNTIIKTSFYCNPKEGDMLRQQMPDYKQSGVTYEYYNVNNESLTPKTASGLIENEKNTWIHPFRRPTYFSMLNLNAYPFVKYPIKVGDKYEWELEVGQLYSNEIWASWDGSTKRKHKYEVVEKSYKNYPFADSVEVYHIQAKSKSEIGLSSADFWFSTKYGFVEMLYDNINESEFNFYLKEIKNLR